MIPFDLLRQPPDFLLRGEDSDVEMDLLVVCILGDQVPYCLTFLLVERDEECYRPLASQRKCRGFADSRSRACDEAYFSVGHSTFPVVC